MKSTPNGHPDSSSSVPPVHEANGCPPAEDNTAVPPFQLHYDPWGRLVFTDSKGKEHVGAEVVRSYPLSDPECWISIVDSKGREMLMLANLGLVDDELRDLIEQRLAQRDFIPIILRIVRIFGTTDPTEWTVETDRGTTTFTFISEDDLRRLTPDRILVTDSHGVRYQIPSLKQMDAHSRKQVRRYL